VLIGATTENPFFEVNPPLRSRSTLFRLEPLDDGGGRGRSLAGARGRGGHRRRRGRRAPGRAGQRRRAPGPHQPRGGGALARPPSAGPARRSDAGRRRGRARHQALRYGATTTTTWSAFIKSIRGSDPDAGCTGWPACSRPARTPASSPAAWSSWPARTSAWPTPWRWSWPTPRPTPSSSWACPRRSSTWPRPCAPGHRAQVEPGGARHLAGPRRRARGPAARCRPTCATPTTRAPPRLGHGKGYDYPHDKENRAPR
jgi:hypothetical protein